MMQFKNNIPLKYLHTMLIGMLLSTPIFLKAATKEGAVKAGFIYNFTKYTVWPNDVSARDSFNLCVFGEDELGGGLDALKGKLVATKKLVVHRQVTSAAINDCHIAFIAKDQQVNLKKTLSKLTNLPILTVSDRPDFINSGGMVGLVRDGKHVAFEVDIAAVNATGIHISAQLLKLAKVVKGY